MLTASPILVGGVEEDDGALEASASGSLTVTMLIVESDDEARATSARGAALGVPPILSRREEKMLVIEVEVAFPVCRWLETR